MNNVDRAIDWKRSALIDRNECSNSERTNEWSMRRKWRRRKLNISMAELIVDFGTDIFFQNSNSKIFNSASFEIWNLNASAWKHVIEDIATDSKTFVCLCYFRFIWFKTIFDFLPFNFPFENYELGPSDRCMLFRFLFISSFSFFLQFWRILLCSACFHMLITGWLGRSVGKQLQISLLANNKCHFTQISQKSRFFYCSLVFEAFYKTTNRKLFIDHGFET